MAEHAAAKVDGVLGQALRWPRIKKLLQLAFQASRLKGTTICWKRETASRFVVAIVVQIVCRRKNVNQAAMLNRRCNPPWVQ
jgi:hypothetical protein